MQPSEFNKRVGENIARLRKGMYSQADLAQALSDLGFPFQQPTVLKVEKGSRPLKFDEACTLADLLGVPIGLLQESSWGEEWQQLLKMRTDAQTLIQREKQVIEDSERAIQRAEEVLRSAESRLRSGGADLRSFEARVGIPLPNMLLVMETEADAQNFSGDHSESKSPAKGGEGHDR